MCKKLHLYRKILLFYAQNSYSVQDFIGKSTPFSHQFPLHIIIYIIQPHNIYNTTSQLPLPETSTSVIVFRPPPDQIPSAVRSDSVRHPIGFRTPPDWISSAVRHTSYAFTSISHNIYTLIPKPSQNTTITSIPLF